MGAGTPETKAHARAEIEKRRQWIAGKQAQLKNKSIFANNRELIKADIQRLRGEIAAIKARMPSLPRK
ncbi:MAG: hypothetical protein ACI4AM_06610 [Muribaculaceae bacterium]